MIMDFTGCIVSYGKPCSKWDNPDKNKNIIYEQRVFFKNWLVFVEMNIQICIVHKKESIILNSFYNVFRTATNFCQAISDIHCCRIGKHVKGVPLGTCMYVYSKETWTELPQHVSILRLWSYGDLIEK